ncbi:MAG: methyl-accepting chemotaxis protein [Melioribacteraceae bacterium]|nr:methyl-accepting chemotaxis protein [Melioribacteraceae bacterium]
MKSITDLKFKSKLQLSYLLLGLVCTVVLVNDLFQMWRIDGVKDNIYSEFIEPSNEVDKIYTQFESTKSTLLKFSISIFESDFDSDLKSLMKTKTSIDTSLANLNEKYKGSEIEKYLESIDKTWADYKMLVIDGTISAAAIKDFDIAAEVASTSGKEIGNKLLNDFQNINEFLDTKGETLNTKLSDIVSTSRIISIIGMFLGSLIFLFAFTKVTAMLTKPIAQLKDLIAKFSLGDFDEKIVSHTKDEFGELEQMMESLRVSQVEKINAAYEISKGNLSVSINELSEKDNLSKNYKVVIENLSNLKKELSFVTEEIVGGKITTRGKADPFNGAYKEIVVGVNTTLDALFSPIKEGVDVLAEISKGDFTARVKGNYKGEHRMISDSINTLGESISDILRNIAKMVNTTSSISEQISSSTEEMAAGAQEQSNQSSEVALSVEEMTQTILNTSKNAIMASDSSKRAGIAARDGGLVVEKTVDGMIKIASFVDKASEKIQDLGKNSEEIGEIVQVIDDIANQTNLLALNAAIEAARAGEQGRGFAVVADEVRKLAERTTKATKEISQMIGKIQSDTNKVVDSMKEGSIEVNSGKVLAHKAGESLREIIKVSDEVLDVVSQVAVASEQQSRSSEQISSNVEAISKVTNETASGIQQIASAADELNRLTGNLKNSINKYQYSDTKEEKYSIKQSSLVA